MKPIVKNENQEYYNAYEINLKINDKTFSSYYSSNLICNARDYQIKKALKLFLSNKTVSQINAILDGKLDKDYEAPLYLDSISTRKDLIKYCYEMMTGEYDFPDDYIDTMMIDDTRITRMEDNEEPFYFFSHDKQYIN